MSDDRRRVCVCLCVSYHLCWSPQTSEWNIWDQHHPEEGRFAQRETDHPERRLLGPPLILRITEQPHKVGNTLTGRDSHSVHFLDMKSVYIISLLSWHILQQLMITYFELFEQESEYILWRQRNPALIVNDMWTLAEQSVFNTAALKQLRQGLACH